MIIVLALFLIIVGLGISLVGYIKEKDCSPSPTTLGIIAALIIHCGVSMLIKYCEEPVVPEPTAIDVYRGNTSLEITYRDSVAVDSVVVFNNKKYENNPD